MQAISPIAASTAVRMRAAAQAAGAPAPAMRRYPLADFLAHLIAVREQAPQTRRRARATPRDATTAYRAVQSMAAPAARYRKSA